MSNVFARLINSEGEAEEINLGSLYIDQDDHGIISHIEIEPYSFEDLESIFDLPPMVQNMFGVGAVDLQSFRETTRETPRQILGYSADSLELSKCRVHVL